MLGLPGFLCGAGHTRLGIVEKSACEVTWFFFVVTVQVVFPKSGLGLSPNIMLSDSVGVFEACWLGGASILARSDSWFSLDAVGGSNRQ